MDTFAFEVLSVSIIIFIVTVPVYFFWRWILRTRIQNKSARLKWQWVATFVTAPLWYIFLIAAFFFSITYYPKKNFDRNKWFTDKDKRYTLSADMISSKLLIGKTKTDVIKLLGSEGNRMDDDEWAYYLGYVPQIAGIDPDVLIIEFRGGKVFKVSQHQT